MSEAAGRVVVITGAAGGIGSATARRFAADGARLALTDQNAERLEALRASLAVPTLALALDLTDPEASRRLAEETLAAFGRVDVLINTIGVLRPTPFEEITPEEWEAVVGVNLTAVFYCCQAFLPAMRTQGYGRVLSMASLAAQVGGVLAGAHYSAAKAGVITLTRSIARRYAEYGVTANCLAPSAVETEMQRAFTEEQRARLREQTPLHRFTEPEEVAETLHFLASPAADTITGQTINLNGGIYFG